MATTLRFLNRYERALGMLDALVNHPDPIAAHYARWVRAQTLGDAQQFERAAEDWTLLAERSSMSFQVLVIVAEKLRQCSSRRLEAGTSNAQARLCQRLVELAESQNRTSAEVIEIQSPLTQQELAEWIGTSRDAVVLALRQIREQGWIETGRRTFRILDLEALRRASQE